MRFAGRQNKVVRLTVLQDAPHPVHVVAGVPPVALGVKITEVQAVLLPELNARLAVAVRFS